METILREFTFLTDEQFGIITKLCLKYTAEQEITRNDAPDEMLVFFYNYVKKKLDKMIKARKRMEKRRAENEN